MKFETPAGTNPIDAMAVVGKAHVRIDGTLKATGRARYAAEHHDVAANLAYGFILGASIPKGRITHLDTAAATSAPGVLAVVTHENAGPLGKGGFYAMRMLASPEVDHYHQPVAVVVAETFEQARAASALIAIKYERLDGRFSLEDQKKAAPIAPEEPFGGPSEGRVGDFERAFETAAIKVDANFSVPDQAHAMMEPHATIALWEGEKLTCWTAIQQLDWGRRDLGMILGIPKDNIRLHSAFIGGGFGGKGSTQCDLALAALSARIAGRPVKVVLQRPIMFNSTIHRPKTIQRVRLGADANGRLQAIGHDSWSGNLPGGRSEPSTLPTRLLYQGENRLLRRYLAKLDMAEGNAMRAPGEAPGMMALEIAMDELAEKAGVDPVYLRILNDAEVDPENPQRRFSTRALVKCLREGAEKFGWDARCEMPASRRDGRWLVGMGVASAIRAGSAVKSAARARLASNGQVTIQSDMTDIGTGSYTIIAQTAAEMLGIPLGQVSVELGDSTFPVTFGSGGQLGAASSTAGVYAACAKLREKVAKNLGFDPENVEFNNGLVSFAGRSARLSDAVRDGEIVAEDTMEYGDLSQRFAQQTFGAHFAEVAVDAFTGVIRMRRMLSVCAAGRILNPLTARSQIIGGMTMGIGAALMEAMEVDPRFGLFLNHDLAGYEIPVHADVPHLEVHFIDEVDPTVSPMKAKGVGELGLSGVAPAIANAVYNATGVRVRNYPITLDKHLANLPIYDVI